MATPILLVCPECGKQIKAPENVLGKKVRCKFCQAAFVAKKAGDKTSSVATKKPPGKTAPAKPAKTAPAKPTKPAHQDDEEEDANPYGMIDTSLSARCPDCANEMEEGAIICVICGYNTQTRERYQTLKTFDNTGFDKFVWLLPGIACALVLFATIGFDIWYLMKIDDLVDDQSWYSAMWAHHGIKTWVIIVSLFIIFFTGRFAIKRLIINYSRPEVEKTK